MSVPFVCVPVARQIGILLDAFPFLRVGLLPDRILSAGNVIAIPQVAAFGGYGPAFTQVSALVDIGFLYPDLRPIGEDAVRHCGVSCLNSANGDFLFLSPFVTNDCASVPKRSLAIDYHAGLCVLLTHPHAVAQAQHLSLPGDHLIYNGETDWSPVLGFDGDQILRWQAIHRSVPLNHLFGTLVQ